MIYRFKFHFRPDRLNAFLPCSLLQLHRQRSLSIDFQLFITCKEATLLTQNWNQDTWQHCEIKISWTDQHIWMSRRPAIQISSTRVQRDWTFTACHYKLCDSDVQYIAEFVQEKSENKRWRYTAELCTISNNNAETLIRSTLERSHKAWPCRFSMVMRKIWSVERREHSET